MSHIKAGLMSHIKAGVEQSLMGPAASAKMHGVANYVVARYIITIKYREKSGGRGGDYAAMASSST